MAVACGAGDDFLADAARAGADVLLTGEARFHRALEAEALGIGLVLAGHHATERPGVEDLAERIARAFPELTVWPSRQERDPLRLVQDGEPARPTRRARSEPRRGPDLTSRVGAPGARKTPGKSRGKEFSESCGQGEGDEPSHAAAVSPGGTRSLLLGLGTVGGFHRVVLFLDASTASLEVPLPVRVVGTARYIWCSHWPDQNWPAHRCSEIARTVGRSSSRITSPHAPA